MYLFACFVVLTVSDWRQAAFLGMTVNWRDSAKSLSEISTFEWVSDYLLYNTLTRSLTSYEQKSHATEIKT